MDDRKYDTNIQNTQLEQELQKLKKSYVSQQMAKSQVVSKNRGGKENGTK